MDFITDLTPCGGFNRIYICVDKLTKFVKLIPISIGEGAFSAPEVACLLLWACCVIVCQPSCGFTWSWYSFYGQLIGAVCGNCWVLGLHYHQPTIHRSNGQTEHVLIGQWNRLSTVLWLSLGSLRINGANSLAQLNWLLIQLLRILQVFHPINWFLARSCMYPLILWLVQLAMCQLPRILLSSSVSWLILFVHLCRGHMNIRQFLLIIINMRRSLLWVIGFCWMLLTLSSLGSA